MELLGVGDAEKNNGLTIIMCNPCRNIRIVTGTQTKPILKNEICKKVINQTIIPEFKYGNFYELIKRMYSNYRKMEIKTPCITK